ncbi:hypothetical protein [Variovorax sp. UC74_104]|uniref:hypothetical protein n=1 Tax=Variovorax sp. UC74_104 TaxID=3374555 RepID=UPI0037575ACA
MPHLARLMLPVEARAEALEQPDQVAAERDDVEREPLHIERSRDRSLVDRAAQRGLALAQPRERDRADQRTDLGLGRLRRAQGRLARVDAQQPADVVCLAQQLRIEAEELAPQPVALPVEADDVVAIEQRRPGWHLFELVDPAAVGVRHRLVVARQPAVPRNSKAEARRVPRRIERRTGQVMARFVVREDARVPAAEGRAGALGVRRVAPARIGHAVVHRHAMAAPAQRQGRDQVDDARADQHHLARRTGHRLGGRLMPRPAHGFRKHEGFVLGALPVRSGHEGAAPLERRWIDGDPRGREAAEDEAAAGGAGRDGRDRLVLRLARDHHVGRERGELRGDLVRRLGREIGPQHDVARDEDIDRCPREPAHDDDLHALPARSIRWQATQ